MRTRRRRRAYGHIPATGCREELARAVRATARGETVLAAPVAARLARHVRGPARPTLTPRQMEVLGGIARGLSNPDIGRELFISEATVKSHVTRIFDRLGVSDRTAAVTAAIAGGILAAPRRADR
jgi:DNA-binding NarL/FixJ family response regulator